MFKRLALVLIAAVIFTPSATIATEDDANDDQPRESSGFTVVRAHALGLWYPNGPGEMLLGRDSASFESSLAPGLSVELSHRLPKRNFGLGLGVRIARVTFDSELEAYGGVPPWGWIVSRSATYFLTEPFVSLEFGPTGDSPRSYRFAAQLGYHNLRSSDGSPRSLGGASLGVELGWCPAAGGRAGTLLDLSLRGSVVLPEGYREQPMYLVSLGIGIDHRFK